MNGPTTKKIHIQTKSILYKKENTNSSDQFTTTIYIYTRLHLYSSHKRKYTKNSTTMPTKKKGGGKTKKKKVSKLAKAKAAQTGPKIVVDKTFGMKNKNKSKKVQKYINDIKNTQKQKLGLLKRGQTQDAADAEKRRLKKAKAKQDAELRKLLGVKGAAALKNAKKAKKDARKAKEEAEKKAKEENEREMKEAFLIPVTELDKAKECEKKLDIVRILAQYIKRDAQMTTQKDGSKNLYIQLADGSTKYPIWFIVKDAELAKKWGDNFKKDQVLDIRNAMAIVRSDKGLARTVFLEQIPGKTVITKATPYLTKFLVEKRKEREEIRKKGGIPIEELIEEERSQMPAGGTPVTKESFFKWLKERKARRDKLKEKEDAKKEKDSKKSDKDKKKKGPIISGRMLYQQNAKLFVDDESAITEKHKGKTLSDDEGDGDDDGADVNSIALKIDSSLFVSEEGDGKPKATEEGTIKVDASLFT